MFDQYQDSYDKELGYEELSAKTLKELLFGRRIVDIRPGKKNYFGGLDISALVWTTEPPSMSSPTKAVAGVRLATGGLRRSLPPTTQSLTFAGSLKTTTQTRTSATAMKKCRFSSTPNPAPRQRKSSPLQATRITASTAMVSSFTSLVLKPKPRTRRSGGTT